MDEQVAGEQDDQDLREIREQRLALSSNPAISTEQEVMATISSERIRDALDRLQPEERSPIVLAFFEGHSYRAVAEKLELPEGTVKSRIRRGMARLQDLLRQEAPVIG